MIGALERTGDDIARLFEQVFALFDIDEAAREDLGGAGEAASLLVDRDDNDDHAVRGKVGTIAEDVLVDVADAEAIDVDVAGGDFARLVGDFFVDLEDIAVGEDERVAPGYADRFRELGVDDQVAIFA